MATHIVYPVLNKTMVTLRGPAWYLDECTMIETISDEDFSAYQRDAPEPYKPLVQIRTKCIHVTTVTGLGSSTEIKHLGTRLRFTLNNFAAASPIDLPFAVVLQKERKCKLESVIPLDSRGAQQVSDTYRLKSGIDRNFIRNYYSLVASACERSQALLFTLGRFNMALARDTLEDRIVDISIALESLFSGKADLRYRFSLSHAFVSEAEPTQRERTFRLLQTLYDVRSAIVHGDTATKAFRQHLQDVTSNWDTIMRITRASLNYYIIFLSAHKPDQWDRHLLGLILGAEARITD